MNLEEALKATDALKIEITELKTKIADAETKAKAKDATFDSIVNAEVENRIKSRDELQAVFTRTKVFAPNFTPGEKTTARDAMEIALKSRNASLSLEGKDDTYVRGAFDALVLPSIQSKSPAFGSSAGLSFTERRQLMGGI